MTDYRRYHALFCLKSDGMWQVGKELNQPSEQQLKPTFREMKDGIQKDYLRRVEEHEHKYLEWQLKLGKAYAREFGDPAMKGIWSLVSVNLDSNPFQRIRTGTRSTACRPTTSCTTMSRKCTSRT